VDRENNGSGNDGFDNDEFENEELSDERTPEEEREFSREELRRRLRRETRRVTKAMQDAAYLRMERDLRRDKWRGLLIAVTFVLVFTAAAVFYMKNYTYTTYSVDSETRMGSLNRAKLLNFGNGTLVIGSDTISYMEGDAILSSETVSFQTPVVAIEGDYYAVCDNGGYQVYIGDKSGIISTVKVSRRVRGLDISASGVIAVFTESNDAAYISYFDRFGSRLAVEVKTVLDASGYPMDISVSPDGQKLLVSYYSTANGIGESRLVLYDFEHGRSDANYIAASWENFYDTNTLLVDGDFFDDNNFVAIGDNEAAFLSYDNLNGAAEPVIIPFTDPVRSVLISNGYFFMVTETAEGNLMTVCDKKGAVYSSFSVPENYDCIRTNGRNVLLMNDENLWYYNFSGRRRYAGALVSVPVDVCFTGKKSLLVNNGTVIERITLK